MKTNTFNICPTCIHREYCVITNTKNQVWSCSEYDELAPETRVEIALINDKKDRPEMAMA
ncbi:hypothetical protein [Altibacter lentus]|uniref:hypothetical protein n=1 Tax=Altibacter lentus TaxID=1223410 RepID=UPI000B0D06A5|nr:hypothetical protein [Altibacter lentus]